MKIRCKFQCDEVTKRPDWRDKEKFLYDAKMSAVSGGSEENKAFWAATPGGQFSVCSVVSDQFVPGKQYYLDITPADAEPASA